MSENFGGTDSPMISKAAFRAERTAPNWWESWIQASANCLPTTRRNILLPRDSLCGICGDVIGNYRRLKPSSTTCRFSSPMSILNEMSSLSIDPLNARHSGDSLFEGGGQVFRRGGTAGAA